MKGFNETFRKDPIIFKVTKVFLEKPPSQSGSN